MSLRKIWKDNKSFFLFIGLMLFVRAGVADWYYIPSGSMEPSIQVGDRILVNKLAYDVRVPFTSVSLAKIGEPSRGDVVVFNSKAADERLIKRVIGLPGDRIAMKDNQLIINGSPINYSGREQVVTEALPEHAHVIKLINRATPLSTFETVTVPDGYLLVLGDNRNNSSDSRVYGFVPMSELVGRATHIVYSLDADHYYLPRVERTFRALI